MKNTSIKIVFFGTESYSLITLHKLFDAGFNIGAVITKPDSKSGRGQKVTVPAVKEFANSNNIPVWQPVKLSDCSEQIKSLEPDIIGVLVSFGKIIPQSIIDLFPHGIINLHPSLLPKYRGPSPVETAIESGDGATGISIMKLSAEMDAGAIYDQIPRQLDGTETQLELYEELFSSGSDRLIQILPNIIDGSLKPTSQNENQTTYCNLFKKEDAFLRPNEVSADHAERIVRAHLHFPRTKITINNQPIIITKSHVANKKESPLFVECSDGKFLSIDELIAPSGRRMTARDFINGYL